MTGTDLEESIDAAAAAALLAEVDADPTIAAMTSAARRLRPARSSLAPVGVRLGCLSSFTFEPGVPALELQGLWSGMDIETYVAPFGQYEQELIDTSSGLGAS